MIWYFAYGSNMHHSAFRERRGMRPTEWRIGRVPGYRLRFNLEGRPQARRRRPTSVSIPQANCGACCIGSRAASCCISILPRASPVGIIDMSWSRPSDANGNIVTAVTYMARGKETDGTPSFRYISLLRDGARAHGLPETW